jgi:succinate dehydrogenase / fumarate reductase iron-sulfur subunit
VEKQITVYRFDPDIDASPRLETYVVEVTNSTTVLDCLTQIKDEQDSSLAFRSSCRVGACGDCATRINGSAALTCKVRAVQEYEAYGALRIEPLSGFEVIRDLVVNLDPLWQRVAQSKPWMEPTVSGGQSSSSRTEDIQKDIQRASFCNLCGICQAECPIVKADSQYAGPAALSRVYRFAVDVLDQHSRQRAVDAARGVGGPFDCVRCHMCDEVCPKGVDPASNLAALRQIALQDGLAEGPGPRHTLALAEDVRKYGRPRELMLAARTWGFNPLKMLKGAPLALRLWRMGKLELGTKRINDVERIRAALDEREKL